MMILDKAIEGYADVAQTKWAAWRRKQRLTDLPPSSPMSSKQCWPSQTRRYKERSPGASGNPATAAGSDLA